VYLICKAKRSGNYVVQSLLSDFFATMGDLCLNGLFGSAWKALQNTVPQSTTGSLKANLGLRVNAKLTS